MSDSEAGRVVEECPLARRLRVRIVLRGPDFEARVGLRYRLEVAGETHRGKVDSGGLLDVLVPEKARTARLQVWEPQEGTRPLEWELELGSLMPTGMGQGARDRLDNLGFTEEKDQVRTEDALADYQVAMRLPVTAKLDPRTREHLDATYHEGTAQKPVPPWRPGVYRDLDPGERP
ncbi:peptidoglycan-binding domain-containing protein [Pyxidicoccus sp. MSG2]|uniref:peptidoglycan-binding domain-containing protein n=1 Tax=Pyxidicoccus sp. MSG2 TaxID=2996790 RepID=UPI00226EB458|nr:peptidoglycan-binding domain-containing protein [Pyxidicoccus sp. MSG2]MCY1023912.1 peptidoglycan-binding domain-containing protein [Pyxidicoccus sp. MSG2]